MSALTFRVRLPSGVTKRVDVDESFSLPELKKKLDELGLTSQYSSLYFGSRPLNITEEVFLKDLGVKSGDFLTISEPSGFGKGGEAANISVARPKITKSIKKGAKGSIAEIERWRSTLIKISRQSPTNTSVRVSGNTFRILNRNMQGGVSILLGKPKASGTKQYLDIYGVCELASSLSHFDDSNTQENILKIIKITKALGQSILGCSIGCGETGGLSWSTSHIYIALQIQKLISSAPNKEFIILR